MYTDYSYIYVRLTSYYKLNVPQMKDTRQDRVDEVWLQLKEPHRAVGGVEAVCIHIMVHYMYILTSYYKLNVSQMKDPRQDGVDGLGRQQLA